jgi:NAD(P)-dependent dehydrogenase (short-subunit alcohol dehydrogenase family)
MSGNQTSAGLCRGLFDGLAVVVAGGGAGLGRRYALDLAAAGAKVLVAGRSESACDVVREIEARGETAVAHVADVRDAKPLVDAALANFGRIDALIVNAGLVRDRTFAKMTLAEWDEVVSVHLDGARACVAAAWPHFLAQEGGRIVLTTSGAGLHGNFGQANYSAAKAAVIGLARSLALEGAGRNVHVNAVAPMALTGMTEAIFSPDLATALTPEGVSPYVLALAHPSCRENGSVIEAGGGWASKLRWERSAGLRLAPHELDVRTVLRRWDEVVDFDRGSDHPVTTAEALRAAAGQPAPSAMRTPSPSSPAR